MRYIQIYLNDGQYGDYLRNCIDILDAHGKSIVRELPCIDKVELEKNGGQSSKRSQERRSNLMVMDFLSFPLGTTTHVVDDNRDVGGDGSVLMPLEMVRASRVLRWRKTVVLKSAADELAEGGGRGGRKRLDEGQRWDHSANSALHCNNDHSPENKGQRSPLSPSSYSMPPFTGNRR